MSEAIPPWDCPAAVCSIGGGSRDAGAHLAHLANPEKSGGAKLRDYGASLTTGQGGAMFAEPLSKTEEIQRRKGMGPKVWAGYSRPATAARPPDTLHPSNTAKKGRLNMKKHNNHIFRRALSLFMALTMCTGILCTTAFAAEEDKNPLTDYVYVYISYDTVDERSSNDANKPKFENYLDKENNEKDALEKAKAAEEAAEKKLDTDKTQLDTELKKLDKDLQGIEQDKAALSKADVTEAKNEADSAKDDLKSAEESVSATLGALLQTNRPEYNETTQPAEGAKSEITTVEGLNAVQKGTDGKVAAAKDEADKAAEQVAKDVAAAKETLEAQRNEANEALKEADTALASYKSKKQELQNELDAAKDELAKSDPGVAPVRGRDQDYAEYLAKYNAWVETCNAYNIKVAELEQAYAAANEALNEAYQAAEAKANAATTAINEANAALDALEAAQKSSTVDGYNEAVGEYNNAVGDYNTAAGNYNAAVDGYNTAADTYTAAVAGYEAAVGAYNGEVTGINNRIDEYNNAYKTAVGTYNDAVAAYNNGQLAAYNDAVDAYNNAVDSYNKDAAEWNVNEIKANLQNLKIDEIYVELLAGFADLNTAEITDEQVEKYNEAIGAYNAAIEEYNQDLKEKMISEMNERFGNAEMNKAGQFWWVIGRIDVQNDGFYTPSLEQKKSYSINEELSEQFGNGIFAIWDQGTDGEWKSYGNGVEDGTIIDAGTDVKVDTIFEKGEGYPLNNENYEPYEYNGSVEPFDQSVYRWVLRMSSGAQGYNIGEFTWHLDGNIYAQQLNTLAELQARVEKKAEAPTDGRSSTATSKLPSIITIPYSKDTETFDEAAEYKEYGSAPVSSISVDEWDVKVTPPEKSVIESDAPEAIKPGEPEAPPTNPSDPPITPNVPDVEIPNEEVPLIETPENPEELNVEILPLAEIPDGDVPLAEIPDGDVPLAEIPDGDVPLADAPNTGDISNVWYVMTILSVCGLVALSMRRKDEEAA